MFWFFLLMMSPQTSLSLEHFLLGMSPSQTSLSLKQVPTLSQCPVVVLGRVLISNAFLIISTWILASHCCAVVGLASQFKINQLLSVSPGKHDTLQLTFGLCSQLLDGGSSGCTRSVSHYHGPNTGCQFLLWVFLFLCKEILSTGPMELKTLTHWMIICIYYDSFHSPL